jgi:hypothetical protein
VRRLASIVALTIIILFAWTILPRPATNGGMTLAVGLCALVMAVGCLSMAGYSALVVFYIGRLAQILAGYVVASLSASMLIYIVFVIGAALDAPAREIPAMFAGTMLFAFLPIPIITPFVLYYAFLPALPTILIAEIVGSRGRLFYASAGVGVALVAMALFVQASSVRIDPGPRFLVAMIGGGIVGGLAYWSAAGRRAGNWRATAQSNAGESV